MPYLISGTTRSHLDWVVTNNKYLDPTAGGEGVLFFFV